MNVEVLAMSAVLLFTGCSTISLDDQYDAAVACVEDCDKQWAKYHRREKARNSSCARGYQFKIVGAKRIEC